MEDLKLEELTLAELRNKYPNISARSKESMLSKIADTLDVISDDIEESKVDKTDYDDESGLLTWYSIEKFIMKECRGVKKILIETPTSIEADLMWSRINSEIFPKLNSQEITVMASSTRRDMHLNGTCYIRLVCHTNFDHIKRLIPYTDYKTLV